MKVALLNELLSALEAKRAVVLATRLPSGEQALLYPFDDEANPAPDGWPLDDARSALLRDQAVTSTGASGSVFLRPYNPPVRVIIVGAVHIAAALADMASAAGFAVMIVDPRTTFASHSRFPDVVLVHDWPATAFEALRPDHRTAVVTLTHDAKLDEPALIAALDSPAFYVGALGSRRTNEKRQTRLRAAGVDEAALARIHAPIGLDIGARSPAEIAVAILAEIVAALRAEPEHAGESPHGHAVGDREPESDARAGTAAGSRDG